MTTKEWASLPVNEVDEIMKPMNPIERLSLLKECPSYGLAFEFWRVKSKRELMQWYMNAVVTAAESNGHGKANRNEQIANEFRDALVANEIPVPADDICYILGFFNGTGSY